MARTIPDPDCPLLYASNLLSGKWKIRLLWLIVQEAPLRFSELKRQLPGISDLALSKCLKEFVESGIIQRISYDEVPPRVEYSLTENGKNLVNALSAIRIWSRKQIPEEHSAKPHSS
ncbi:MAG: helix-turn-helix transcriptional regulator [Desulfovibrionaceae bacterium]|nr:helix-turn-helix transcriptional regulator [Desulfovibrionaceae bacterium]